MKTLFKSHVFAALVALFLSIPLSGCFEEGAKTSGMLSLSQKEGVADGDGVTKFRFKKGTKNIGVDYSSQGDAAKYFPQLKEEMASLGIKIIEVREAGRVMVVIVEPLEQDIVGKIHTTGIVLLRPWMLSGSPDFTWIPMQGFV